MAIWQCYYLAQTIEDALKVLAAAPGSARLIAGGTDLLLDLQQGRQPPVHTLVDITTIPELNTLELRGDALFVGAGLSLNRLISAPLVSQHAQALHEACSLIGGPQVRNTATLGGNVAHALPAADGSIALLALNAQAEVVNLHERRRVPLTELFLGPGRSALQPQRDLLVGFYLPLLLTNQASAHRRIMRPQGVAIAILNIAIWIEREEQRIKDIRIALGPAGPIPHRARSTEAALRGQSLLPEIIEQALQVLLSETHFRTSPHRAGAEYRQLLTGVLLKETINLAWSRTFYPPVVPGEA